MLIKKVNHHAIRFILPLIGTICLFLGGCTTDEPEPEPTPSIFPAYRYDVAVKMQGMYHMRFSYGFPGLSVYGNDIPVPASISSSYTYRMQISKKYSFEEEAGLKIVGNEEASFDLPKAGERKLIEEKRILLERDDPYTLTLTTLGRFPNIVEEEEIKYIRIGMKNAFPIMISSTEGNFMFKNIEEFDGDTNIGLRIYPGSITSYGHNFIYQPCLIYDHR